MKRRIIIITSSLFPRGDANANYIENIALLFRDEGYTPIVIAKTVQKEENFVAEAKEYKGIKYYLYSEYSNNKVQRYIIANFTGGRAVKKILSEKVNIDQDTVLVYSHNGFFINSFYGFCKKKGCKISMCITEDLQRSQTGLLAVLRFKYTKRFVIGKSGSVLPISRALKQYYDRLGCHTFMLPPLVDPYEYEYCREKQVGKINLIYSGNGRGKDSYKIMLDSIRKLSKEKRRVLVLNFTGLSKEKIMKLSGYTEEELDELGESVKIHPWMEYSELIRLYSKMDYLYMPRVDSIVTRSNFPSKIPELLAYGVCPVITDVGDCTEYLCDGKNAIIVSKCETNAFTRSLERIIRMSDEKRTELETNARKTAEEMFYYKNWSKKILKFVLGEGDNR